MNADPDIAGMKPGRLPKSFYVKKLRLLKLLIVLFLHTSLYGQKQDSLFIAVNFREGQAQISARYFYLHNQPPADSLFFMLSPAAGINSIRSALLKNYKFVQKAGRPFPFLLLHLTRPIQANEIAEVDFDYTLDLAKTNYLKYNWVEMMVDQFWYPNARDVDNKFKSRAVINDLYENFSLFSYQPFKKAGNGSYEIRGDVPSQEISFLAGGNMRSLVKKSGKISITWFVDANTSDTLIASMQAKLVDIMTMYNHGFGKPAPVYSFAIAFRPVPRNIINSQTTRKYLVITGKEFNTYGDLAHELGHFWWSDASFVREPWLNESFANYNMMQVLKKYDTAQYRRSTGIFKRKGELKGAVASVGVFTPGALELYFSKGTYLLELLEKVIGKKKDG